MYERAFKVTTTYPFPCMIFSLCRSAGVPIWHIDQLKTLLGTVDIGLIRDEANELAPHRGPRPETRGTNGCTFASHLALDAECLLLRE